MRTTALSRREFVALAAGGAVGAPFATRSTGHARAAVTAQDVIDRIRKNVGVKWKPDTVDTFKAGAPGTVVTGIAATAMATMAVLKQAVESRANLVITCEPTFYGRADSATPPPRRGGGPGTVASGGQAPDPVFTAKNDFITKNNLVVWRFSDHWRLRKPDPLAVGLADALGWSGFTAADNPARVSIPAVTLDALAAGIKKKLDVRGGMRIIGDPQIKVTRIGLLPGSTPIQAALTTLPQVDVIVAGEVREWETAEYARDAVTAGQKKGLILLGRVLSEEPGMKVCASWLETIVPEVKATWIRTGDPYWRPA